MRRFEGIDAIICRLEIELGEMDNMVKVMTAIGNEEQAKYYEGIQRGYKEARDFLEEEQQAMEWMENEAVVHPDQSSDILFTMN